MYSHTHFCSGNKLIFILLSKVDVKRKELSVSGVERDVIVSPGTLLESLDLDTETEYPPQSYGKIRCRTLDASEIYLTCETGDLSLLDVNSFYLLLPVQSLKDRYHVFKDKHLLNDGILLQNGDSVFVRPKGLQTQTELEGNIRYKGAIDNNGGTYFGVELKENRGNCDGTYNKARYFLCSSNYGVFVPISRIRRNRGDWQKNDLLRAGDLQVLDSAQLQIQLELEDRKAGGVSSGSERVPSMNEYGELKCGDRVIWPSDFGDERGVVRWIGILPDETRNNVTIGVEFDNPVGTGTGKYRDRRLFYTKQAHASLIPPIGLMKDELKSDPIYSEQEKLLNDFQYQRKMGLSQQDYQNPHKNSKANVNKTSLPANYDYHTGFRDRGSYGAGPVNGASGNQPMTEPNYIQGRSHPSNGASPDLSLSVGCIVEVQTKIPLYGVIRWIGEIENRLTAGLELETKHAIGTDGMYRNERFFFCEPGKAFFVPLKKCVRDKRFEMMPAPGVGGMASPDVSGDIPTPEIHGNNLVQVCGKNRGIQGHHNSCYLDSTLFCMFYFSTVFDSIFNRPPNSNDLPEYTQVQKVLKDGIVNPLRKHNYVASNNVWRLRTLLDKLGTVEGMMGEEKDVEEFLSALLSQIMKADPLLHLSTGEHAYFYQLFMEKDDNLLLPTTQKLVELSFLQGNVKLKQVPACLMIQMPRFGKDFKMFRRIVPSLELDITDILENSPRDCIVCGVLATWECKQCYQVHGHGLNTTAFCDKCRIKSHQHTTRKNHQPLPLNTDTYLPYFQQQIENKTSSSSSSSFNQEPCFSREKMELFAVICIQTSHYVSFVKCGPGLSAPWVFFDSMADRIGEQGGYNVPEVTPVPEMTNWLSEKNIGYLNNDEDKELPEHLRRLLCDGYMCMYQSPNVMMFQ